MRGYRLDIEEVMVYIRIEIRGERKRGGSQTGWRGTHVLVKSDGAHGFLMEFQRFVRSRREI